MIRLLLLASILAAGCVRSPTANEVDDMLGHPTSPLLDKIPSCPGKIFYRRDTWTYADSGQTCPNGWTALQVGYNLIPLEGSCMAAQFSLHGYTPIYGCPKGTR